MNGYNPAQMKVCLYCGRTNPLSASLCAGCGASKFEIEPLPLPAPLPPQPYYQQVTQPMPTVRVQQIHPAIMVIYFFLFGFILAFFWLLLTLSVALTVIGIPLATAMMRVTPTVAALYRNPQYSPGDALRYGWSETLSRYRAASPVGKVVAPVTFVLCVAVLLYWIYGRR